MTARMQVLSILDTLVRDRGIGPIVISHDLNLVCNFCDRVLMPSAGRVVESLQTSDLDRAQHPYAQRRAGRGARIATSPHGPPPAPKRGSAWPRGGFPLLPSRHGRRWPSTIMSARR
ncbi:ABC transporter ATP-binding protein [Paracoccus nototheniae]|uniref:ABC transporter ATP-binding protein n=1 Tax=Paracoccus nototheniae TaxID=2489002 RepID=A0ABW4E0F5_9RHOB|nr:ABC transporter ATP-binding protein [Paracoccus nototheniae]